MTSRSAGEASSTRLINRATARASPASARWTRSGTSSARREVLKRGSGGRDGEQQRVALTDAAAQGRRAEATAAALELVGQVQHDARPTGTDRVAERDRT